MKEILFVALTSFAIGFVLGGVIWYYAVGRLQWRLRRYIEELEKNPAVEIDYGDWNQVCGSCLKSMTRVGPGKYRCDNSECEQTAVREDSELIVSLFRGER